MIYRHDRKSKKNQYGESINLHEMIHSASDIIGNNKDSLTSKISVQGKESKNPKFII